jgi:hypothetical protein
MRPKYLPVREMEFAARVGFLTRNLWREFFAYGHRSWKDKVWLRLKQEGFFRAHAGMPDLYLPNAKNRLVDLRVPFVAKPPMLSQLDHDELVARSYLLLKRELPGANLKTEAYLKKEVPISNKGVRIQDVEKHPDLVLELRGEKFAFEVELSQKSRARYRSILRCYRRGGFKKVIYLIRGRGTMNAVESAAHEVSFPRDQIQLGFGSIGEWRANPLKTEIHFDHSSEILEDVLGAKSELNRSEMLRFGSD